MRHFLLLLLGLAFLGLATAPSWAGHKPVSKIFLRVHIQTNGEGLSPAQATPVTLPSTGETIQVRTLPELTEEDLTGVQPIRDGTVRLTFNRQGQVNLNVITVQNQGRMLVVLLNGFVIYSPVIDQQITNGELDLPRPLDPRIIALLQEVVQNNLKEAAKG